MILKLQKEDLVSRCIIYKRAFNEQQTHDDGLLWIFGRTADDGASHESGILRRIAVEDDDVHRIGCSTAHKQNDRLGNPDSGDKKRYYCGCRTARYQEIPLSGEGFSVKITHKPEDGENAHLDIALTVDDGSKSAKANFRTNAGLALAECFGPAFPYICPCDTNDNNQPIKRFGLKCLGKIS